MILKKKRENLFVFYLFSDAMNDWEKEKDKNDFKTDDSLDGNNLDENKTNYGGGRGGNEKKQSFQCKTCYKKFNELAYLRSHMVTHSTVKPHKCTMCEKSFTRRRELLRHENVHTGFKPFKCKTCGKAFSRKDKLVRHEKIHNGVKKFYCTFCPTLSFVKIEDLILHHRSVHSEMEVPYVLPPPPPSSSTSSSSASSTNNVKYQCEICLLCYGNMKTYQDHLKSHNKDNDNDNGNGNVVNSSQDSKMLNGADCDCGYSDEEKFVANSSLEQLNSNPAITITSVSSSKSSASSSW